MSISFAHNVVSSQLPPPVLRSDDLLDAGRNAIVKIKINRELRMMARAYGDMHF